jgi:phage baseplate assembly protein W
MSNLGTDTQPFGANPRGRQLVSDEENLALAIGRRYITPRGALFYAPGYGYDVRANLNATDSPSRRWVVANEMAAEAEQDPRVLSATVTITDDPERPGGLVAAVALETLDGPFSLIVMVSDLAVEVLRG